MAVKGDPKVRLLRQIADADALGGPSLAGEVGVHARHHLHQRGLARAVGADDRDLRTRQELKVDIVQDRLVGAGEGLGQTLHHIGILDGHGGAGLRAFLRLWDICRPCSGCAGGWQTGPAARQSRS